MRIKLDQNLSQYLRDDLTALKHDVDTVLDQGLSGAADPEGSKQRHLTIEYSLRWTMIFLTSRDIHWTVTAAS